MAPCVLANFVETIDGVVAIPALEAVERPRLRRERGRPVRDGATARLRERRARRFGHAARLAAAARGGPSASTRRRRTQFAALRRARGMAGRPAVAIVTAGGSLDPYSPGPRRGSDRADAGAGGGGPAQGSAVRLRDRRGERRRSRRPAPRARVAARARSRAVLCEAGPDLLRVLVAGGLVDELFLTVSPVLAGRGAGGRRLALAEGVELMPGSRPRAELLSARRAGAHLFLRYRLDAKR